MRNVLDSIEDFNSFASFMTSLFKSIIDVRHIISLEVRLDKKKHIYVSRDDANDTYMFFCKGMDTLSFTNMLYQFIPCFNIISVSLDDTRGKAVKVKFDKCKDDVILVKDRLLYLREHVTSR